MKNLQSENSVQWPRSIKSSDPAWVYPLVLFFMGSMSGALALMNIWDFFATLLANGLANLNGLTILLLVISLLLIFSSAICLLHFFSFATRKYNQICFDEFNAVYRPSHIAYELIFESNGWQKIQSEPYGFDRGFKKISVPIKDVFIRSIHEDSESISLQFGTMEIVLAGFKTRDDFEATIKTLNTRLPNA